MRRLRPLPARAGFSLLELIVAVAILGGVLYTITSSIDREQRALDALASRTNDVMRGQLLIGRIDDLLSEGQGTLPDAWLAEQVDASETSRLDVDSTLGFPDRGTVIVEPGGSREERIDYEGLRTSGEPRFLELRRGVQCTNGELHPVGSAVLWSGVAYAIANQSSPPASAYSGRSLERGVPVYFRGDGQGFSFRVPVDPAGSGSPLDGLEVQWGARLRGQELATGRCALVYEPVDTVREPELSTDLNGDGDQIDEFDLGEIHLQIWDTSDGGLEPQEISLGGAKILQEVCAPGGDIDGDGFEDPIFLWDPETGRLRVRLFLASVRPGQVPVVERLETVLHLRNPGT